MGLAADSPYRVPFDCRFKVTDAPSSPAKPHDQNKALRQQLSKSIEQFEELQRRLLCTRHSRSPVGVPGNGRRRQRRHHSCCH